VAQGLAAEIEWPLLKMVVSPGMMRWYGSPARAGRCCVYFVFVFVFVFARVGKNAKRTIALGLCRQRVLIKSAMTEPSEIHIQIQNILVTQVKPATSC
jgi:hypothetical protein